MTLTYMFIISLLFPRYSNLFNQTQDEPISQTLSDHRIMRSVHPECGRPSGSAAGSFQAPQGALTRAQHDRV